VGRGGLDCFGSYDIRGRLGAKFDAALCRRIGRGFARVMEPGSVVVGRDIRPSSPGLQAALIAGLRDEGCDVIDLGLCATEEVYFATGHLGAGGGLMVTASHNPADWNGIKLVGPGARPVAGDSGLDAIRDLVAADGFGPARAQRRLWQETPRAAYAARVAGFLETGGLGPLTILVNAGHGVAGPAFDAVAALIGQAGVPWRFERINHDPDGSFPAGIPNPLLPENRPATARAVVAAGADLGIAWDGDGDRCFLFDAQGGFVDGEHVVALLAQAFLARHPGARIVHDPRVIWNTVDAVARGGGVAVPCRTGHAHMKAKMREADAVYGGEMSAHHYFREFLYCDSGIIPAILVAGLVARSGRGLAGLVGEMRAQFPSSGEINFAIADKAAAMARVEAVYGPQARGADRLDGLSLDLGDWRLNLRASNTEDLLRLNLETRGDRALLVAKVAEVSALLSAG
jgi:phosphomannomutase